MTIKTGKGAKNEPLTIEVDPLLRVPIPHAYALVPHPDKPGLFYAVHLEGVSAERLTHVEPSARPSHGPYQLQRIYREMETRHRARKWGSS